MNTYAIPRRRGWKVIAIADTVIVRPDPEPANA